MIKEEATEILSEMRSEYNLFGDEEEATKYHVLSWAIKAMKAENGCEYWDSESHFCVLHRPQAEPVKHGRWIERGDNFWECSECHEISCCKGNYCVDCGADMRERGEDVM